MTLNLCEFTQTHNGEANYCKHRDENGECSKRTIHVKNGEEGYALFEPCCQDYELGVKTQ